MTWPDQPPPAVHPSDELLADLVLAGDDADVDARTRAHVADCERCTGEVAALRETRALVGASGPGAALVVPPASVWAAVGAEIDAAEADDNGRITVLAERAPRARRRVPTWLAATAAAAALVIGVGLGMDLAGGNDETPVPRADVVGSAQLASLDDSALPRGSAQVRRDGDRAVLSVAAADLDGPDGTRQVWLINLDGTRMVSVGLLPDGKAGEFEFPARLLDEGYRIVDISYEPDDGDPLHSGDSLARGTIES